MTEDVIEVTSTAPVAEEVTAVEAEPQTQKKKKPTNNEVEKSIRLFTRLASEEDSELLDKMTKHFYSRLTPSAERNQACQLLRGLQAWVRAHFKWIAKHLKQDTVDDFVKGDANNVPARGLRYDYDPDDDVVFVEQFIKDLNGSKQDEWYEVMELSEEGIISVYGQDIDPTGDLILDEIHLYKIVRSLYGIALHYSEKDTKAKTGAQILKDTVANFTAPKPTSSTKTKTETTK